MDKNSLSRRIISMFTAFLLVFSVLTAFDIMSIDASAASASSTYSGYKSTKYVNYTTGSGWQYNCGVRGSTITIKNTGKSGLNVYNHNYCGFRYLAPGRSVSITFKGWGQSGKTKQITVQRLNSRLRGSFTATSNVGSIRVR